jgi:hypothetical protein
MAKTTCKLCGKEANNLFQHLKLGHKMTIEEYDKIEMESPTVEEEFTETEELTQPTNPVEIRKNIFDTPKKYTLETSLADYIKIKDIKDLGELDSIVERFVSGASINVTRTIQRSQELGNKGAQELKDQDQVETKNLHVAESLVKSHGFIVKTVSGSGTTKKWVLEKK